MHWSHIHRFVPDLYDVFNIKIIGWMDGMCYPIANKWSSPTEQKDEYTKEKNGTAEMCLCI